MKEAVRETCTDVYTDYVGSKLVTSAARTHRRMWRRLRPSRSLVRTALIASMVRMLVKTSQMVTLAATAHRRMWLGPRPPT